VPAFEVAERFPLATVDPLAAVIHELVEDDDATGPQPRREALEQAHGLDRRRLQGAVARLAERGHRGSAKKHDRALGGDAAAADDLDAYLGSLDKDRVRAVARLKVAFDARAEGGEQPEDGADSGDEDARLDLAGFRGALAALGRDLNAPHVREYLDGLDGRKRFLFLDFVDAYVLLFASEDPDLRMSTGAAAAIGDRVRLLKGGQVLPREDRPRPRRRHL